MTDGLYQIPGWHCWEGVAGLWYGRRIMTSPPVVLRAETPSELRAAIEQWNQQRHNALRGPVRLVTCDVDPTLDAVPVDLQAAQAVTKTGAVIGGFMTHVVRLAGPKDAAAAGRLLYDFNREFGEPTPAPSALAERMRQLLEGGDTLILLAGDGPDGLAVLRFRAAIWSSGLECYLAELYVAPAHRGQGLGRALMEAALREARGRGADTMDIGVDEPDLAARRLYESLGFTNRAGEGGPVMYVYEREL
jgi:ribosomal protein S18 acetylase RimI-like enzyme